MASLAGSMPGGRAALAVFYDAVSVGLVAAVSGLALRPWLFTVTAQALVKRLMAATAKRRREREGVGKRRLLRRPR